MERTHGPDLTFAVHPRPASEDPRSIMHTVPMAQAVAVEKLPVPAGPAQVVDDRRWDTFLGNLHFLFRYALGQY